jgi:small GTP-binding protein
MSDVFLFDAFLSHSSRDKEIVRPLAERLIADGLRVWFDEWNILPGDNIPATIERGLESSRVLVLFLSCNALGSDWAQLESGTFRFRDPMNKERRFIPIRLDDTPLQGSIAQFLYIDWRNTEHEREYKQLLEACRKDKAETESPLPLNIFEQRIQLPIAQDENVRVFSYNHQRKLALTAFRAITLWQSKTAHRIKEFGNIDSRISSLTWSLDGSRVLVGSVDSTIRLWDIARAECLAVLAGHTGAVSAIAWTHDLKFALSASEDRDLRLWDIEQKQCVRVFPGHEGPVRSIAWGLNGAQALSGSSDRTIKVWDVESGRCLQTLEGHTGGIRALALSANGKQALSASADRTVRLWDIANGRCLQILEGHSHNVWSLSWSRNQRWAISGSMDKTVRLWNIGTGECRLVIQGFNHAIRTVEWIGDEGRAVVCDSSGSVSFLDLSAFALQDRLPVASGPELPEAPDQVQYTNAKVLLVGDSGVGKTGLSMRLASDRWQPTDSTVGAWATQWRLPVSPSENIEKEIWIWDFGGQADQRLIHQLYLGDCALAVLVFDGQKENLVENLAQWTRDIARGTKKHVTKLLVAARIDAGGLRSSRHEIEKFAGENDYSQFFETSAKSGLGCAELRDAILTGIEWKEIPWRSSPTLFKQLKDEIIRIRDEGRILLRFNELRDALRLRLAERDRTFQDSELKAVVGLLAGPGIVWELKFGSWVLFRPEMINAYAQAVIHTMQSDEDERGAILEERVLNGDLAFRAGLERLEPDEERFVILAMHQTLVERGLCLREHTDKGPLLVFPSYYRRERPELIDHPAVLVSYRFNGFLDEIYATLVVRLHHTRSFQQDQLWKYAAEFLTLTGRKLGIKMTRRAEGSGELEVYFESSIPNEEKIIFSKYIHEHLLQKSQDLVRYRHYVCPKCGTPVENRDVAMRRLSAWLEGVQNADVPSILCVECEMRLPLWDELEQCFASAEMQQRVKQLQETSMILLDNESKERALVGEVISTAALAGQICREFNVSDHGIDMEIEFKNDSGEATGKRIYLQLKSGDSYLRTRQNDGVEVFQIRKPRHLTYWMGQPFPVFLVVRNSKGQIRWMDVRSLLRDVSDQAPLSPRTIVFNGEKFDVMAIRRLRQMMLQ